MRPTLVPALGKRVNVFENNFQPSRRFDEYTNDVRSNCRRRAKQKRSGDDDGEIVLLEREP